MKNIPIKIGIKGEYDIEIIDSQTNNKKFELKNQKNMILDNAFQYIINTRNSVICGDAGNRRLFRNNQDLYVHCGSGSAATTANMTHLQNRIASRAQSTGGSSFNSISEPPFHTQRYFVFQPGSYVGTLRELGLGYTSNSNEIVTRSVLPADVEILATDELRITWRVFYNFPTGNVWQGTIVNGQSDGVTDINWKIFVNYAQVTNLLNLELSNNNLDAGIFSNGTQGPFVVFSSSNADSDVENDAPETLKGSQLHSRVAPQTFREHGVELDVIGETWSREIKIGFEHDAPNNIQFGEIVVWSQNFSNRAIFRATFDPPINKAEFFRMFITYELTLTR